MFKQFVAWLLGKPPAPPTAWPEDIWEKAVALSEFATLLKLAPIGLGHFDIKLNVYSDTVDDLFKRLEIIVTSIEYQLDVPASWKDRRRLVKPINVANYYFDKIPGYRDPQEVVAILAEKIAVIHYLLDEKGIDAQHPYHPYLRREFSSVIADTVEVLEVSLTLPQLK